MSQPLLKGRASLSLQSACIFLDLFFLTVAEQLYPGAWLAGPFYFLGLQAHGRQTLAQQLLGLAVLGEGGRPLSYRASLLRLAWLRPGASSLYRL